MTGKGVEPDVVTYNSLMDGYCLTRQVLEARKILDVMACKGCTHDPFSFSILIDEAKQL